MKLVMTVVPTYEAGQTTIAIEYESIEALTAYLDAAMKDYCERGNKAAKEENEWWRREPSRNAPAWELWLDSKPKYPSEEIIMNGQYRVFAGDLCEISNTMVYKYTLPKIQTLEDWFETTSNLIKIK